MFKKNTDILIIGGGIVGLSLAYQLSKKNLFKKITVIDKENKIGQHNSGRNSGVLHAGIYYKPNSLKAKVCMSGAKRLKKWIKKRNLPINNCGKIILPQKEILDSQLDFLYKRGKDNEVNIEMIDIKEIKKRISNPRKFVKRAIWSPETSVVDPLIILNKIKQELVENNVEILLGCEIKSFNSKNSILKMHNDAEIHYGYLFNTAGIKALEISKKFGVGTEYLSLPFKGNYWEIKKSSKVEINTNVYPVPDLSVPFLGVHFTPNVDNDSIIIGPTATLSLGRENYKNFQYIEPLQYSRNLGILLKEYMANRNNFRRYVHEQAFTNIPFLLYKAASELIPDIKPIDLKRSTKVGIRAQLFHKNQLKLEDDFLCISQNNTTHVLNAVSPAFTASFSLADLIINKSNLNF